MKQNAIRLYKHALEMIKNPKGVDSAERDLCRKLALKAKEDWENHFKTANKYKNDPEIKSLLNLDSKPKEKEDGKKSKG